MNHPEFFRVHASVYGAKHTLTINDIPISMDHKGYPLNSEFPISHCLGKGTFSIGIDMVPLKGKDKLGKEAETTILVRKFDSNYTSSEKGEVIFTHIKKYGELENLPAYKFEGIVGESHIQSELPWSENLTIDITDQYQLQRFLSAFKGFYDLFREKEKEKILDAFQNKFDHYENRYKLPKGERKSKAEASLSEVFDNESYKLLKTIKDGFIHLRPLVFSGGKLVTLVDKMERLNYIMYYSMEEEALVEFPIFLGMNKSEDIQLFL